jgi:hypothetical protein
LQQQNFFLFLVERNSANFAPLSPRKSFVAHRLVRGGGAKLTEFRSGGGAKLSPGGAKFVSGDFGFRIARAAVAHPLRFAALTGAHNYWVWVLRICPNSDISCQ